MPLRKVDVAGERRPVSGALREEGHGMPCPYALRGRRLWGAVYIHTKATGCVCASSGSCVGVMVVNDSTRRGLQGSL